MGPGRGQTRNPWICSQTRLCSQTCYRLRFCGPVLTVGQFCKHLLQKKETVLFTRLNVAAGLAALPSTVGWIAYLFGFGEILVGFSVGFPP